MAEPVSKSQIDCILYNYRSWIRLVSLLCDATTSGGIVVLPVSRQGPKSPVERIAIRRAEANAVLDVVIATVKSMPRDLRQIEHMRYNERLSYREIADVLTRRLRRRENGAQIARVSTATVYRKVEMIQYICMQQLASVSPEFWHLIETLEIDFAKQTV